MSTDPVIDVDLLLRPLEGEKPAGEELPIGEPDGLFMRTKDAWDEARKLVKETQDKERNGGIDSQGQPWRVIPLPDWDRVIDLGTEILAGHSKDFRIAAWLAEALLRKHHARGLRDGLQLCAGLCNNFWDQINPPPNDEDGHSVTLGAFSGLVSEATFGAVLDIPVAIGTKPGEREVRQYSTQDHRRATDLAEVTNPDDREQRMEAGHITLAEFDSIVAVTEREFHDDLIEDLIASSALLDEVGEFVRTNARDDQYDEPTYPGVTSFRETIESVIKLVRELRGEEETDESGDSDNQGVMASGGAGKDVMTREIAFQAIERIAQFFERTEPHTPIHFALRQAIRWGRMPLPDLLAELIDDEGPMDRLRKLVGLPKPPEDE